ALTPPQRERCLAVATAVLENDHFPRAAAKQHQGLVDDGARNHAGVREVVAPGSHVPAVPDEHLGSPLESGPRVDHSLSNGLWDTRHMAEPVLLAIDQGTSSARAIGFDRSGAVLAQAQQSFAQI